MRAFICPSCHKVYDNDGICKICNEKLIPLSTYLNAYEKKIKQKINTVENILSDLEKVYANAKAKQKLSIK